MLPRRYTRFRGTEVLQKETKKWNSIALKNVSELDTQIYHLLTERRKVTLHSVTVSRPSDLVQGTLDLLLLRILAHEPMHGWAISRRLNQMSDDVLNVSDGSLYPALHKLEHRGWIKADWRPSENNRRAKFYSLTKAGRRQLEREAREWERLSGAISALLRARNV